jgi:type IV secretory pathway VirD2 relaxase
MARVEAALAAKLDWVAVDHWDTDNAHTHIILRGRGRGGGDLVIPREFVKHGFRAIACDVATERLGKRTPGDERAALRREAHAHRPTRLDRHIALQAQPNRHVRIAQLELLHAPAELNDAITERARELVRLGLAREVSRNVLTFSPDWQERLEAMELHLDIRKSLMKERNLRRADDLARKASKARSSPDR